MEFGKMDERDFRNKFRAIQLLVRKSLDAQWCLVQTTKWMCVCVWSLVTCLDASDTNNEPQASSEKRDHTEINAMTHFRREPLHMRRDYKHNAAHPEHTNTPTGTVYSQTHSSTVTFARVHLTPPWLKAHRSLFFFYPPHTHMLNLCRKGTVSLFSLICWHNTTWDTHTQPHLIKGPAQETSFSQFVQLSGSGW